MRELLVDLNPFVGRWDKPCRFKVWRRQVWCDTIQDWLCEMAWCHVVLKIFGSDIDAVMCKCGSYGTPE